MPIARDERRQASTSDTWGVVSLASAIASPCFIVLIFPGALSGWATVSLLFSVFAAVVAVVAGGKSGKWSSRPSSGRTGFVIGLIEIVVIVSVLLLLWAFWGALNESL